MRMLKITLMVTAALLMTASVQANWSFDSGTSTFTMDPGLVTGDLYYDYWRGTGDPAGQYLYSHDMVAQTGSWYGPAWSNMRSRMQWTGPEAAADFRIDSTGALVAVRASNWYNANDTSLALDHYFAYSSDDGANYNRYFEQENWNLGSPAGTGYGNTTIKHTSQSVIANPGLVTRLQYGVEELTAWSEWYGSAFRVWGKSSQTEYHDNYTTNPTAGDVEGGPFWSTSQVGWSSFNSGAMSNTYSSNPTEAVYIVSHQDALESIDIRLTSTDLADNAEATWTPNADVEIKLAIATEPDGTWTDVWAGSEFKSNAHNPGALVDLDLFNNPDTVYVKIYSDDNGTGNHFIRWGGFHVALTPVPEPATMTLLGLASIVMLRKRH